ncbi:MAG: hypothetical protein WBO36_16245, partial [Saprospiraceae bacterium]
MKTYISLLYCIFFTGYAQGQVNWTGGHMTDDWHQPLNWDCNCVPSASSEVIISLPQQVVISATAQAIKITISSGATLINNSTLTVGSGFNSMVISGAVLNSGTI